MKIRRAPGPAAPTTTLQGAQRTSEAGFTLVEIIAVIALIAVSLAAVAVTIGGGLESARVRAASRDLAAALRYTRGQAIVAHEERALEVDVEARSYTAPGRKAVELPKKMTVELFTASQELLDDSRGMIRFFPDGSSTGGQIALERAGARWRIEVSWLTGTVKIREGAEAEE